jgi:hypothetical protein
MPGDRFKIILVQNGQTIYKVAKDSVEEVVKDLERMVRRKFSGR